MKTYSDLQQDVACLLKYFLTLGYHDNNANTTAQDEVMFYFQDPSNPPLINSTNSTTS